MSKDHFYFSRNDRIVALVLLSVILIAVVARIPFNRVPPETTVQPDTVTVQTATPTSQPEPKREYTRSTARYSSSKYRKDSVQRRPARRDTVVRRDSITYPRYTRKQPPASPLDLNTADSTSYAVGYDTFWGIKEANLVTYLSSTAQTEVWELLAQGN